MESIKRLYLTFKDLERLEKFKIGRGTDGTVYRLSGDTLIKIYHRNLGRIKYNAAIDDSDIKIYDKGQVRPRDSREPLTYYQFNIDEDIRVRSKFAIYKAIDRQQDIELTNLPTGVVYLNEAFAGCMLKRSRGFQIHKLQGLPLSVKREIMTNVLKAFKELITNYIYPTDLSNSPYSTSCYMTSDGTFENVGHSHVLVQPFSWKTNIIDVDGKSAIYMERFSSEYLERAEFNFNILLIEFLLSIDTDLLDESHLTLEDALSMLGVEAEFIDYLSTFSLPTEGIGEFIASTKQIKKLRELP